MDQVVENLHGLRLCNYSSMGALTFTIHDIIASMEEEVEQIWRRPWTNLKLLHLSLRFISLGSQLVSTVVTLSLPSNTSADIRSCRALAGFQGVSSQVLMMAVQVILILRVQALFHEKRYLKHVLRGLFLAEIVIMSVLFAVSMPDIQYGLHCVITSFPAKSVGFFVPPILFEFFLFVLTMIKFFHAVREGWGHEPVITRFLKDGIWAFALPFTMLTVNALCMALLSGAVSSVAYSWAIAVPGFAGCRLILNMSHLFKPNRDSLTQTYPDHGLMDTIILTNDITTGLNTYELHNSTFSS